jgi:small subunit ribosomal protein S10
MIEETIKKVVAKKVSSKTAKTVKAKSVTPKLRIKAQAFESKILDASIKQIIDTAKRYDAEVVGPIPMPTRITKYTVLRSSFVYKNSREQFEMRVHKRVVDIMNPNSKITEALTNLSLPSGVHLEVKMM